MSRQQDREAGSAIVASLPGLPRTRAIPSNSAPEATPSADSRRHCFIAGSRCLGGSSCVLPEGCVAPVLAAPARLPRTTSI